VGSTGTGSINIDDFLALTVLDLSSSTGSIDISNCQASTEILASTSTGDVRLLGITSDDISASSTTGSITMNIIGVEDDYRVQVAVSTGDINFQGVKISNQTLNPTGSKNITAETSTGDISIHIG
jgi:DUF4097 and DUF4098 domain-containing protein YvlB